MKKVLVFAFIAIFLTSLVRNTLLSNSRRANRKLIDYSTIGEDGPTLEEEVGTAQLDTMKSSDRVNQVKKLQSLADNLKKLMADLESAVGSQVTGINFMLERQ